MSFADAFEKAAQYFEAYGNAATAAKLRAVLADFEDNCLERLVQQVRETGLSTGHASTPEELMGEVLDQVRNLSRRLNSAHARLLEYDDE